MFASNSSSSSEDGETPRTPFNAVSAAAAAQRQRLSRQSRIARARAAPADAEAFAYDEALETVELARRAAPRPERKSRYIGKLVKQVEKRKDELQQVHERRLVKEREQEDHLYKDKERFVTKAYKKQLEERAERDKEDREQEEQLESRRADVSGFLRDLRGRSVTGGEDGAFLPLQSSFHPGASDEIEKEATPPNHGSDAYLKTKDPETALENPEEVHEHGATALAAPETGKKRRRTRFADVTTDARNDSTEDENGEKAVKAKPKRGLRRNDERAIEAYRQRFFERRARRLAAKLKKGTDVAG